MLFFKVLFLLPFPSGQIFLFLCRSVSSFPILSHLFVAFWAIFLRFWPYIYQATFIASLPFHHWSFLLAVVDNYVFRLLSVFFQSHITAAGAHVSAIVFNSLWHFSFLVICNLLHGLYFRTCQSSHHLRHLITKWLSHMLWLRGIRIKLNDFMN